MTNKNDNEEVIDENNFDDNVRDIINNKTNVNDVVLGSFGSKVRTIVALIAVIVLAILGVIMGIGIIISEYKNGEFPDMGWSFNIILIILGIISWEYVGVNKTINTLNGFRNGTLFRKTGKK